MGGMDEAPARIDRGVVEQPFDRPRLAQGQAVLHLAELLGDVDVDGPAARRLAGEHLTHRGGRHRAQRMQGQADAQQRRFERAQAFDQSQKRIDLMPEAALPRGQCAAIEAAAHVERRQQGEANAGFARCLDQRQRHLRRIGVGATIGRVMQVMELADLGIAGLEHLDIELGGDGLQFIRANAAGKRIHDLAPGPEAVVGGCGLAITAKTAALGQPRHRTLERM